MKTTKYLYASLLVCLGGMMVSSCDKFLDREPITNVTPAAYFSTPDQVKTYVDNYFGGQLIDSRGNSLWHTRDWNNNRHRNDSDTDNLLVGQTGNLSYFAGQWESGSGQALGGDYTRIRVWNYLINTVELKKEAGILSGAALDQYLGEAYFFRAMAYYNAMVKFGDLPIITEVMPDNPEVLFENAPRRPRNEVARFILSDLDVAIALVQDKSAIGNQRINKQVAQLFKSRVALFEATFEKYHKGTGRVPGDAGWPGASKPYNSGKSFNISSEIEFFLGEAMTAAAAVADGVTLTQNTGLTGPASVGVIYGWNPYFEMFSQPSLKNVDEVLLWKEYGKSYSITHNAFKRSNNGDNHGYTRSFMDAFLMANGLPIYAAGSGYKGDKKISDEKEGRDDRLRLFVWGDGDVAQSDLNNGDVANSGELKYFSFPLPTGTDAQTRDVTGYRPRKYAGFDWNQMYSDELLGTNACPVFRAVEAHLNYMEACYEKNGSLDAKAQNYWRQIRTRANVDPDFQKTIDATDMAREIALQELDVWSGDSQVDATLYNIRRERRCEFISEGYRWDDLKRWRSWDRLFAQPYIVEGFNLWDEAYKNYEEAEEGDNSEGMGGFDKLVADGTTNANVSPASDSKYLRPLRRSSTNNALYDGYTWRKAYYLNPLGMQELQLVATDPNDLSTSNLYQNPYWNEMPGRPKE